MTHTPAPWRAGTGITNDGARVVVSEDGRIADVHVRDENAPKKNLWQFEDAEREANARLIAAAPDLLAALENINKFPRVPEVVREVCRAAIAKAKGETK
jgi:K+/H+ antiporter YhaU regulatory subunit KhtT